MNRAASSIPSITAHTVLNNHHGSVCSVNFSDLIGDYYYLSSVGNDYSLITYRLRDDHSLSPYWTLPNAHNRYVLLPCCDVLVSLPASSTVTTSRRALSSRVAGTTSSISGVWRTRSSC